MSTLTLNQITQALSSQSKLSAWQRTKRILMLFAATEIFCLALVWLMFLTVAGTIAQRDLGLYRAQQLYFSSFIYWVGDIIPTPGGYTTMGVIFVGLLIKLLFDSTYKNGKVGILITHIGALMLLLGGFLTAVWSQEGAMVIPPGQTVAFFSDYHDLELAVINTSAPDHDEVTAFGKGWIQPGKSLSAAAVPFEIEVQKFCRNCRMERRSGAANGGMELTSELRGFAANFELKNAPEAKEAEQNQPGVTFRVRGSDQDGIYSVFEEMQIPQTIQAKGKSFVVELRRARTQLPFALELLQFEKKTHPGTSMAKSYKSVVNLKEGELSQRTVIQMNEPLRHKGYIFYQSSFVEHPKGDTTILAVVKNAGATFPYISSIIMCLGLLIHLMIQFPKLVKGGGAAALSALLLGASLMSSPAQAANPATFDQSALAQVPLQHEGRIKPLDTFARVHLLAFYGKSKLPEQSALSWLTELLLDPDRAYERKVFNIADPAVAEALSLERNEGHKYSFSELLQGIQTNGETLQKILNMDEKERSGTQNHMVEVYEKFIRYLEISRSLSAFMPEYKVHSPKLAATLGVPADQGMSFRELTRNASFEPALKKLIEAKGEGLSQDEKREVANLFYRLDRSKQDVQTEIFRIIPPQWDNSGEVWLSPTALMGSGLGSPVSSQYINYWKTLYEAYHQGDAGRWKDTSTTMLASVQDHSQKLVPPWKLKLENLYNRLDLFTNSLAFYILSFLLLAASWLVWPTRLMKASFYSLTVGFALHLVGMVMRIVIMGRPPVATLYESIIFVGLIAVLFGLVLEKLRKNTIGIMIGSLAGAVLQFMGTRYETSGDTMGMLVAVLNTNFWLATHVVTISIGYGTCYVGGILAHIYLLFRVLKPGETQKSDEISRNMVGVALVATFFAMFGTILGGIWADQSWGRFWGWDPKENGALWIVLWLLFLLHARLCGMVGKIGFATGMVFTNVIVALAWFGVNLLNVGLHSYGFTKNIAVNLGLFCGLEILFAVVTYALAKHKEQLQMAQGQG